MAQLSLSEPQEVKTNCFASQPSASVDQVHVPFRCAGVFVIGEGIGIIVPKRLEYPFLAIDFGGLAVDIIQRTDIVQAARMVFVVVRKENGIQVPHPVGEHLGTEIRSGVHQDGKAVHFHQGR